MNDNLQTIYNLMVDRNFYQGSYDDFAASMSLVDNQKKLHQLVVDKQLYQGDFNSFSAYLNTPIKKKDSIATAPQETAFFGDGLGGFGDFFDDVSRAMAAQYGEGKLTKEVADMMGGNISDEDLEKYVSATDEIQKYGMSDERRAWQQEIKDEGDTVWNTVSAYWHNPTVLFEDALGSLAGLVGQELNTGVVTGSTLSGAATGGAIGATAGGIGAGPGAAAGSYWGLRSGIGAASGVLDATATFSNYLREELESRGMDLTKENARKILADEEWLQEHRNKAIKGGAMIGVFDFITFGLAGTASKGVTKPISKTLVAGSVEAAGGMAGEAAAELSRGEELSPSAIIAEAAGEFGMGTISAGRQGVTKGVKSMSDVLNPPKYYVNGKELSKDDFTQFIETEKDLTVDNDGNPLDIKVENDKETAKVVEEKVMDQTIEKSIDPSIQGEDRKKLVALEKERAQKADSKWQSSKRRVQEIDKEIDEILSKERPEATENNTQAEAEDKRRYKEELEAAKEADPEGMWSVTVPDDESIDKGTVVRTDGGVALVDESGDIRGLGKTDPEAKGVGPRLVKAAVKAGGRILDNFDMPYLTKIYKDNGFRIVSRTPFNEQYAPKEWNNEKHGKPDVVLMVYDPDGKMNITEETFGTWDSANAYREKVLADNQKQQQEAKAKQEQQQASNRADDLREQRRRFTVRAQRTYKQIKDDIVNNPENYFTPQKLADIRADLENMTMDELVANMNETSLSNLINVQDQTGVLAGIEALNRAMAEGTPEGNQKAAAIVERLGKLGTSVGRLLRHFGELKNSTVKGMYDVVLSDVESKGQKLTDAQREKLMGLLEPVLRLQKEMVELIKERNQPYDMTDVELLRMENDFRKVGDQLNQAQKRLNQWMNANVERGYGEIGTMLIQGNLLTPMSQMTNIFANIVNMGLAIPRDFISLPIDVAIRWVLKTTPPERQYSLAAYMHGLRLMGPAFVNTLKNEVIKGEPTDYVTEWRVQRGFMPIMSFLQGFHNTGVGTKLAKKYGMEVDAPISKKQMWKLRIQGTFGVPAELMFRFLSLGDTPFRKYMEGKVLYQAAKARKLEGRELELFLKYPPEDVMQEAQREGRKLTFQEKTETSETLEALVSGGSRILSKILGRDIADFVVRTQVPYVRTPANILSETMKYSSFAFAMASASKKIYDGKITDASQDIAKGFIGLMMAQLAHNLIAEGLLSGEIEYEEDEKKKNLSYDQFPPNSINVSGLQRLYNGDDPAVQPNDRFFNYTKLGIPGVILGSRATLAGSRVDEVEKGFDLFREIIGLQPLSTLNHVLNQSFLQGVNNLTQMIGETDEERLYDKFEKWIYGTSKAMTSTVLPNTLSAINRVNREFLPDTRVLEDMSRSERFMARLKYTIMDRTFNLDSAVPVRVNWKGEKIKQTPTGADPFAYHLYNILKARNAESDPISNEVYRLYNNTGEVSTLVSTPYFARARAVNVPDINSKKHLNAVLATGKQYSFFGDPEFTASRIKLNTEQINALMEVAGKERYALAQQVMAHPNYANLSDEGRIQILNAVNDNFRSTLELNEYGGFRNHTVLMLDFIEEMYRNERGQE